MGGERRTGGWEAKPFLLVAAALKARGQGRFPGLAGLPQHPSFRRLIDRLIDLAVMGLCCCTRAFSSCGERGLRFLAVHEVLITVASLVAEHGL